MSDERLRELERVWLATGAPVDELTVLRLRLRAGLLTDERVALAASLGHEGAQRTARGLALRWSEPQDFTCDRQDDDLGRWQRFEPWLARLVGARLPWSAAIGSPGPAVAGREARIRLAIAAASAVLPAWERAFPGEAAPRAALHRAEEYVALPDGGREREALAAGIVAYQDFLSRWPGMGGHPPEAAAALAAAHAALAVASRDEDLAFEDASASSPIEAVLYAVGFAVELLSPQGAFDAFRREVIPWALGHEDVVRTRAAMRGSR